MSVTNQYVVISGKVKPLVKEGEKLLFKIGGKYVEYSPAVDGRMYQRNEIKERWIEWLV